jgi:hypothetical protein
LTVDSKVGVIYCSIERETQCQRHLFDQNQKRKEYKRNQASLNLWVQDSCIHEYTEGPMNNQNDAHIFDPEISQSANPCCFLAQYHVIRLRLLSFSYERVNQHVETNYY